MKLPATVTVPKLVLTLLNNVYEIEKKAKNKNDPINILRNIEKIKDSLAEEGFILEDPYGQTFKETRNDLEVSISGNKTTNLMVVEVLKPIIRCEIEGFSKVVQKGIVIVASQDEQGEGSHE